MSRRVEQRQQKGKRVKQSQIFQSSSNQTDFSVPLEETEHPEAEQRLRAELEETKELLAVQAAELRRTTLQLATAEQRERDRLARILHDDLQQLLLATQWNLRSLKNRVTTDRQLGDEVDRAIELLNQSIETSRSLSRDLSPPVLEAGLLPAIGWLVQFFQQGYLFDVTVQAEGSFLAVPDDIRDFAFQSIRELLLNASKHSNTNRAELQLKNHGTFLEVTVSDLGVGFDPVSLQYGFGLSHISSRVARLGGELRVESRPERGATFRLIIPYSGKIT